MCVCAHAWLCVPYRETWNEEIASLREERDRLKKEVEDSDTNVLKEEVSRTSCLPGLSTQSHPHHSTTRLTTQTISSQTPLFFSNLPSPMVVCEQIEALEFQRDVYISELEEWVAEAEKHIQSLRCGIC